MNRKGFTLVELLLVMAIIGILGSISTLTFLRARDRARVTEVTSQLAADLQRIRSSSRRDNVTASISWTNSSRYTLNFNGQTLTRTFPAGITVTMPNVASITYDAPLGERSITSDAEFRIVRTGKPDIAEVVTVLGVTGKVYRKVPPQ